jgi:hypothetical protein
MLATQATIPKFNRMGRLAGLRSPNSIAIVTGSRTDHEGVPRPFRAVVERRNYIELWHEGIYIFHNPRAVKPLDPDLFPHVIHIFQKDMGIEQWVPPEFIVSCATQMVTSEPSAIDQAIQSFEEFDGNEAS